MAKTVIDEMKIKVDEDTVYEYYRAINEAYEKEDHYGLVELFNELTKDNDLYTVVWYRLGSEIRTHVRKHDYFKSEEE